MTSADVKKSENAPLPTSPEQLLERLTALGIDYTLHEHAPVYTVAESEKIDAQISGVHCRNLFLRDKKKQMFLVVAPNETPVDLKKLPDLLDCGRLSFGSAARLWQYLGVRPGSVCPYAVINDKEQAVQICLDKAMMEADIVNYHPLENDKTISIKPDDLLLFIKDCGHEPRIIDLALVAPDETR